MYKGSKGSRPNSRGSVLYNLAHKTSRKDVSKKKK